MKRSSLCLRLSGAVVLSIFAGCSNPLVPDAASESKGQPVAGISAAAPAIGSPRTDIGALQQGREQDAKVIQDATNAVNSLTMGGR